MDYITIFTENNLEKYISKNSIEFEYMTNSEFETCIYILPNIWYSNQFSKSLTRQSNKLNLLDNIFRRHMPQTLMQLYETNPEEMTILFNRGLLTYSRAARMSVISFICRYSHIIKSHNLKHMLKFALLFPAVHSKLYELEFLIHNGYGLLFFKCYFESPVVVLFTNNIQHYDIITCISANIHFPPILPNYVLPIYQLYNDQFNIFREPLNEKLIQLVCTFYNLILTELEKFIHEFSFLIVIMKNNHLYNKHLTFIIQKYFYYDEKIIKYIFHVLSICRLTKSKSILSFKELIERIKKIEAILSK